MLLKHGRTCLCEHERGRCSDRRTARITSDPDRSLVFAGLPQRARLWPGEAIDP